MKRFLGALVFVVLGGVVAEAQVNPGVRATGAVSNDCVKFVSAGVITSAGAPCGSGGGGTGTVTSVGITAGSGITASGTNPVTTSGNIGVAVNTGTSGHTIPFLDGANTWSANQTLAAANSLSWTGRAQITSPADGQVLFRNAAGNNFTRMLFGGTTVAFPAIQRNGSSLDVRLADGSSLANLNVQSLSASASIGAGVGGEIAWNGSSAMEAPADGQIVLLNTDGNGFSLLQFGGTGPSYPALKRNSTALEVRLADDSGFSSLATGTLNANGALATPITSITTTTSLNQTYFTVLCDASSGDVTLNLPVVSSAVGRLYNVKKVDSTGNSCILDGNGSETIDGATTKVITIQWQTIQIQANSAAWFIL